MPCPTKYGTKEAAKDRDRLMEFASLRENGTALTEAQKAEEAHLRARLDVFNAGPEAIARRRRAALQDAEQRFKKSRLTGDFYAPPLSRKDRNTLKLLRWLYPAEPKLNLSELDDDGFEMHHHPFADELPAPDGNSYPRHSKLRPAGAADDRLVQTQDGPPMSPVTPGNAPATDPNQSVESPRLRQITSPKRISRCVMERAAEKPLSVLERAAALPVHTLHAVSRGFVRV